MEKISAVYQIINTVTGDRYVGSSKDVKKRWQNHKCPSTWERKSNKQLYKDFQKYGLDKFRFHILAPVMPEHLKQVEQEFIEILKPTYNNYRAKGHDDERYKESQKEYRQTEKWKEIKREADRKYRQTEKCREVHRKYDQSEKGKERRKNYWSQICSYNGETLTLKALFGRFQRAGIPHPCAEARKYLVSLG